MQPGCVTCTLCQVNDLLNKTPNFQTCLPFYVQAVMNSRGCESHPHSVGKSSHINFQFIVMLSASTKVKWDANIAVQT